MNVCEATEPEDSPLDNYSVGVVPVHGKVGKFNRYSSVPERRVAEVLALKGVAVYMAGVAIIEEKSGTILVGRFSGERVALNDHPAAIISMLVGNRRAEQHGLERGGKR